MAVRLRMIRARILCWIRQEIRGELGVLGIPMFVFLSRC